MNLEVKSNFAFDLEGTLIDLEPLHQQAFAHVAKQLGVVFGSAEFHNFVGAGDKAISEAIARLVAAKSLSAAHIREMKNVIYHDLLHSKSLVPRDGVVDYLEAARMSSGDLIIATLTPRSIAEFILNSSGLHPFFKHILDEASVTKLKPDPEVYLRAANTLGTIPERMLVHEDSPPGVASAKAAGSSVVAFPVYENLTFNPRPDAIFLSWVGLNPGAIYQQLVRPKE